MIEGSPATIGTLPKSAFAQRLHIPKDTKTFSFVKHSRKKGKKDFPKGCISIFEYRILRTIL